VTSATFAERPICPYCDGPLIRRTDDDVSVLQHRMAEFNAKTQPLAALYEKKRVLRRIDGNRDREAVFADISGLIDQSAV
jgi:adenylate kinase